MSDKTNISWCDSTANMLIGCDKISPGCAHCYAAQDTPARVLRSKGIETWGPTGQRVPVKGYADSVAAMNRKPWICKGCGKWFTNDQVGEAKFRCCPDCSTESDHYEVRRRRIFHGSNHDIWDNKIPIEVLADGLDSIRKADACIHILCSKRWENFQERLEAAQDYDFDHGNRELCGWLRDWRNGETGIGLGRGKTPPANIIGLCSVENQQMADVRIPQFLTVPLACRGLSMEPLLGPVDVSSHLSKMCCIGEREMFDGDGNYMGSAPCPCQGNPIPSIDWLIIGGESGKDARPCNVEWIRSLVAQGKAAGVQTFVKQLGAFPVAPQNVFWDGPTFKAGCPKENLIELRDKKGGDMAEWPEDLRVREFPRLTPP